MTRHPGKLLRDQLVSDQAQDQVWARAENQVHRQVWDQMFAEVRHQVRNQVWQQLRRE